MIPGIRYQRGAWFDRRPCPACGKEQDDASNMGAADLRPKAGDVGICFDCGTLTVYDDDNGTRRLPTEEERAEIMADPRAEAAIGAVLAHLAVERAPD